VRGLGLRQVRSLPPQAWLTALPSIPAVC